MAWSILQQQTHALRLDPRCAYAAVSCTVTRFLLGSRMCSSTWQIYTNLTKKSPVHSNKEQSSHPIYVFFTFWLLISTLPALRHCAVKAACDQEIWQANLGEVGLGPRRNFTHWCHENSMDFTPKNGTRSKPKKSPANPNTCTFTKSGCNLQFVFVAWPLRTSVSALWTVASPSKVSKVFE